MTDTFTYDLAPSQVPPADDTDPSPRAAVAFLLWVIAFTALAIAPAVVISTWRWFL